MSWAPPRSAPTDRPVSAAAAVPKKANGAARGNRNTASTANSANRNAYT